MLRTALHVQGIRQKEGFLPGLWSKMDRNVSIKTEVFSNVNLNTPTAQSDGCDEVPGGKILAPVAYPLERRQRVVNTSPMVHAGPYGGDLPGSIFLEYAIASQVID